MPRILDVRTQILKKNDTLARELRTGFRAAGVFVVSLVSSPGSGKTTFLTETLKRLMPTHRVAALVGDLSTENDAKRLATSGAPVRQIVTGTVCHLEAEMVAQALGDWDLDALDILFIENVGNLVCPSSYDLGEDLRLVLLSTTKGEDKPLKYPTIFNTADVAVITKSDLADVVEFDRAAVHENIQNVRPGMPVLEVSARNGAGMDEWMAMLMGRVAGSGAGGEDVPHLGTYGGSVICERVLGNVDDPVYSRDARDRDAVRLTWRECSRRFQRKVSEGGRAVGLLLPVGPPLRHGDVLFADERVVIHVSVIEAAVLEIPTPTPRVAAGVAYELGAMHCPIELGAGAIYVAADEATEAILRRMGIVCRATTRRFEPTDASAVRVAVAGDFRVGDGG